jgi:hypothetical protein
VTWKKQAACRDFPVDRINDVFFVGETASTEAKDLCATCPVIRDCGEAGRREQWGVWGGRGPKERGVVHEDRPTLGACYCGTEFTMTQWNRKHCSDECAAQNKQGAERRIAKEKKASAA